MKVHATCGRGTEIFAIREVKRKLKAELISQEDGKIFFKSPSHGSHADDHHFQKGLLELKTVERVFVTCVHFATSEIKGSGKLTFLRKLKEKILDPCSIKEAVSGLEGVRSCSSKHDQTASQRKDLIRAGCSYQQEEYAVSPDQSYQCKKPCSDSDSNLVAAFTQTALIKRRDSVERSGDKVPSFCNHSIDFLEQEMPQRKKPKLVDDQMKATAEATEMLVQQARSDPNIVTFRFSVKCAGWCRKWLHPQRLSKECGLRLCHLLGWKVDLHSPMYDIHIHINDDYVTAGVPITRSPLSRRHYLSEFGLRSTVGWIMADLADIQPGDHVLDPMCGKGIILIEAAREAEHAMGYVGCDIDGMQLEAAARNLASAQVSPRVQLMQTNAEGCCCGGKGQNCMCPVSDNSTTTTLLAIQRTACAAVFGQAQIPLALPFRDSTMDKIICDAPFGYKFTVNSDLQHFYGSIMAEIERVLVPEGRLVLLTSQDLGQIFQTQTDTDKPKYNASVSEPSAECDQENDSTKLTASDQIMFKTSRSDQRNLDSEQCLPLSSAEDPQPSPFIKITSLVPNVHPDPETSKQLQTILKRFSLLASYYIKLGETHSSIVVLKKRNNKN